MCWFKRCTDCNSWSHVVPVAAVQPGTGCPKKATALLRFSVVTDCEASGFILRKENAAASTVLSNH